MANSNNNKSIQEAKETYNEMNKELYYLESVIKDYENNEETTGEMFYQAVKIALPSMKDIQRRGSLLIHKATDDSSDESNK